LIFLKGKNTTDKKNNIESPVGDMRESAATIMKRKKIYERWDHQEKGTKKIFFQNNISIS
jgi:hypothetical protein